MEAGPVRLRSACWHGGGSRRNCAALPGCAVPLGVQQLRHRLRGIERGCVVWRVLGPVPHRMGTWRSDAAEHSSRLYLVGSRRRRPFRGAALIRSGACYNRHRADSSSASGQRPSSKRCSRCWTASVTGNSARNADAGHVLMGGTDCEQAGSGCGGLFLALQGVPRRKRLVSGVLLIRCARLLGSARAPSSAAVVRPARKSPVTKRLVQKGTNASPHARRILPGG